MTRMKATIMNRYFGIKCWTLLFEGNPSGKEPLQQGRIIPTVPEMRKIKVKRQEELA
jgi:hypothetical protein